MGADPGDPLKSRPAIGLLGLLAILFLTVSGGPYGLEPLVASVGGRDALALLVLVPLVWSLPVALMAAELSAALPLLGGYYQWVRRALGEFWGFQEGWWSWLFTWVDMPLYPALSVEILRQSWPLLTGHALSPAQATGFVFAFITLAALINWSGTRVVADCAIVCTAAVLVPFVIFVFAVWREPLLSVSTAAPALGYSGWALGLSTVMWNYAGWDNVSTFAPSVRRPARVYPQALFIGIILIAASYLGPVAAGLRLDPNAAHWQNGYFVTLGARVLGPRLALIMSLTGVLAAWAQYTAQLLYVLPLPVALARDGYLPHRLAQVNRRGVATPALLFATVIYSLCSLAAFSRLVVADILLYSAGLGLEFVALWMLRRNHSAPSATFRIPLSGWRLIVLCALPLLLAAITGAFTVVQDPLISLVVVAMLATGPVWFTLAPRFGRRGTGH